MGRGEKEEGGEGGEVVKVPYLLRGLRKRREKWKDGDGGSDGERIRTREGEE